MSHLAHFLRIHGLELVGFVVAVAAIVFATIMLGDALGLHQWPATPEPPASAVELR
jgi:hypothetical protein